MSSTSYSRTRYRNEVYRSAMSGLTTNFNPGSSSTFDYSGQLKDGGSTEIMSDIVTPDWLQKRSKGVIVNNPLSLTRTKVEYASSSHTLTRTHPSPLTYSYQNFNWFGNYNAYLDFHAVPAGFPGITSDTVADVALNEEKYIKLAAIKARKGISPILVQSLVSVVELPKTLSLIASSLSTVRQILKSCKTGNPDYALRAIGNQRSGKVKVTANFSRKTVHDRWLELRYGWTPLVFEVQGVIKALNRARTVQPVRATSRGFENVVVKNNVPFVWNNSHNGIYTYRYERTKSLSVRAYVLYTAALEHQQARDYGVTELPLALWELQPYSFVVDWFVNIGDWIEALTPKLGINILAEGYTVKSSNVLTRTLESWTKQIVATNSYDLGGTYLGSVDKCTVEKYVRVPRLTVLYSLPPVNVRLDKKRVLDAIALISKSL